MKTTIPTGDLLDQDRNAGILRFTGRRSVISTGALNGGIRHDLTAIYNHNDCPRAGKYCEMQGDTMEEHQAHIAASLGLDPQHTTGLHTGANIDNTAIVSLSYDDFSVTAMVTAGVEVNACRVGDPAVIHERDGGAFLLGGTINIVVAVDANLTDHCLARALVTCTEAKVAALQELVVSGRYSMGLATGSGTDGTIIVGNSDSAVRLTEAGEQYKLGEYLGKAVMQAVKQALYRQTGLCTGMQHSVFRRLERFGVTEPAVWEVYLRMCSQPVDRTLFADMMDKMSADGSIVTTASLYAHLLDQMLWGLILPQEAVETGNQLLELMNTHHAMPGGPATVCSGDSDHVVKRMADAFVATIVRWVLGSQ